MKRLDYKTSRKVEFKPLYDFLSMFVENCQNDKIKSLFYVSESLEQLQLNIQDDNQASNFFFRKLKQCADFADHYIELEKFIIYMGVLLGTHYKPLQLYKKNLLNIILNHIDEYFTSDEYCVIRHLVSFNNEQIDDIIALGQQRIEKNNKANQFFTCEIYLIEGQYKKALSLVEESKWNGILLDYKADLLHYKRQLKWQSLWQTTPKVTYQQRYA